MGTPINKYEVLDPKGVVWDGKVVGKGGEITSTQDGRINGYLHFKQIKKVEQVGETQSQGTGATSLVGNPAAGAETLARTTDKALGNLGDTTPKKPNRPDVSVEETKDGGTETKIKQEPGELPVFEDMPFADLRTWATNNNIDLAGARSQEAILAAVRKAHPLK